MRRMRRTQVYLDPELSSALDRLARERRTSRATSFDSLHAGSSKRSRLARWIPLSD
ncbi:MAG: ribbon-helix-helix protein, CopG family [Chloroflexi bacterium]|nr:ribbon-helix-helix protein, CopG family [Chloroflexota bacterium]